MLYDPKNHIRESYLRAKYQMFVNGQMRQTLASKILVVKDKLNELNEVRSQFFNNQNQKVKSVAHDVVPNLNF